MAINVYTLNGQSIDPKIDGLERTVTSRDDVLTMAPKNDRFFYRSDLIEWTFTRRRASVAIWTIWKAAAVRNASVTLVEPNGDTHTVKVLSFSDPIDSTKVASGEITRNLTIRCRTL